MSSQKKKVTLYFNASMLAETQKEALRQDRSVSWIIQAAWRIARDEVRQTPGVLGATAQKPAQDLTQDLTEDLTEDLEQLQAMEALQEMDDATTPPPLVAPRPVSSRPV